MKRDNKMETNDVLPCAIESKPDTCTHDRLIQLFGENGDRQWKETYTKQRL